MSVFSVCITIRLSELGVLSCEASLGSVDDSCCVLRLVVEIVVCLVGAWVAGLSVVRHSLVPASSGAALAAVLSVSLSS